MKKLSFLLVVLSFFSFSSFSDEEKKESSTDPREVTSGGRVRTDTGEVKVFDDQVFADPKAAQKPSTSKGPISGRDRAIDPEEPEYNSAQRKLWMQKCEPFKADPKKYRPCFQKEREKAAKDLQEKFDRVEKRQAQPMETKPRGPTFDENEPAPELLEDND